MGTLMADKPIQRLNDENTEMTSLEINGWTFLYNPSEVSMTPSMRQYLCNFQTDDDETVFVLAMHDDKLVVY